MKLGRSTDLMGDGQWILPVARLWALATHDPASGQGARVRETVMTLSWEGH